jgi:hypothetical protein
MSSKKINSINTIQIDIIQYSLKLFESLLVTERRFHNQIKSLYEDYTTNLKEYSEWCYEKEYQEDLEGEQERMAECNPHDDFLLGLDEKSYQDDIDYNQMTYNDWRSFKIKMQEDQYSFDDLEEDSKDKELSDEEREKLDKIRQKNKDIESNLISFNKLNLKKEVGKHNQDVLINHYEEFEEFLSANDAVLDKYNLEKEKVFNEYTNEINRNLISIKKKLYNNAGNAINLPIEINKINEAIANNSNSNHKFPNKSDFAEKTLAITESILTKLFAYTDDEDDDRFFDSNDGPSKQSSDDNTIQHLPNEDLPF